jgi:hypothetical protein
MGGGATSAAPSGIRAEFSVFLLRGFGLVLLELKPVAPAPSAG